MKPALEFPAAAFHHRMFPASLPDNQLHFFGNAIFQPIGSTHIADLGRYIAHDNDTKTQFNGKQRCAGLFVFCSHCDKRGKEIAVLS
jgi:hypothetical protein